MNLKLLTLLISLTVTTVSFSKTLEIKLSTKGNNIAFDKSEISTEFEKSLDVLFVNKAALDSQISHNIAIVEMDRKEAVIEQLQKSGYSLDKVAKMPGVLALSRALEPGESDRVTFKPPRVGKYYYICLMPGHGDILGMIGVMTLTPPKQKSAVGH